LSVVVFHDLKRKSFYLIANLFDIYKIIKQAVKFLFQTTFSWKLRTVISVQKTPISQKATSFLSVGNHVN